MFAGFCHSIVGSLFAIAALGPTAASAAQSDYPSRPIRMVVPFVAGGSTDIIARLVGQKLNEQWGRPVVVDNRGGANGVIAMEIALARAKPTAISFGTAAVGSIGHLSGELMNRMANVQMPHVPYKGGGQAVTDVLGGQIPLVIIGMTAVTPHVRAGRLRAIFTTGAKRSFAFPDVPTVSAMTRGIDDFAA